LEKRKELGKDYELLQQLKSYSEMWFYCLDLWDSCWILIALNEQDMLRVMETTERQNNRSKYLSNVRMESPAW